MRVSRKKLCSILMRFRFDDGPAAQVVTSRRDTAPVHLEGLAERRAHLLDLGLIILRPLHPRLHSSRLRSLRSGPGRLRKEFIASGFTNYTARYCFMLSLQAFSSRPKCVKARWRRK